MRGCSGWLVMAFAAGCASDHATHPAGAGDTATEVATGPSADDSGAAPDAGGRRAFPDGASWSGTRAFAYDSFDAGYVCEATVAEHGARVDAEDDAWDALVAACPRCDAFHRVESERHEVCGWLTLPEAAWRGLHRGEDGLEVVILEDGGDRGGDMPTVRSVAGAEAEGDTIRYAYTLAGPEGIEVRVHGDMTFRAAEDDLRDEAVR